MDCAMFIFLFLKKIFFKMLSLGSTSTTTTSSSVIEEEAFIECTEKTLSMISSLYLDENCSDCVLISKTGKRFPALRALVGVLLL